MTLKIYKLGFESHSKLFNRGRWQLRYWWEPGQPLAVLFSNLVIMLSDYLVCCLSPLIWLFHCFFCCLNHIWASVRLFVSPPTLRAPKHAAKCNVSLLERAQLTVVHGYPSSHTHATAVHAQRGRIQAYSLCHWGWNLVLNCTLWVISKYELIAGAISE